QFNAQCKSCHDCREAFLQDSLNRADTSNHKSYIGSRTAYACTALQKLQTLLELYNILQAKVSVMEHKYKSYNDSMYQEFINLNKSWYATLDKTVQYYNSFNESAY
ncbi:MAG: hypothetical protein H7282_08910, partial [Cytophagaceae bacterium]|nr:hypothetical protein [Cytophagaceae bacterium]